jgi:hypothetical protein
VDTKDHSGIWAYQALYRRADTRVATARICRKGFENVVTYLALCRKLEDRSVNGVMLHIGYYDVVALANESFNNRIYALCGILNEKYSIGISRAKQLSKLATALKDLICGGKR